MSSQETVNWSRKSLEELRHFWNVHIEQALLQAGHDLETRPTYQELLDVGYGGIVYTLREHHGLTLGDFLETVGYEEHDSSDVYSWGISDETTLDEFESYIQTLERRRELASSTIETKRSRLATYARIYRDNHGKADFVDRVDDTETRPAEIERVLAVFDDLDRNLESDASKMRYLSDVRQFYEHLQRRGKAAFNPAETIDMEYGWEVPEPDNPALSSDQVKRLYAATDGLEEELLVLALCAWGLRRSEVAALHVSQLVLEGNDPHIAFDDSRKNGPGTVALIYGRETLVDRIDNLGANRQWNGYLFPSSESSSGHIVGETVQSRFQRLADQVGVRVRQKEPTSKMGRRFWYTTYTNAVKQLAENLQIIADDQGSSDEVVVLENYLSEAERRRNRRELMRKQLADAFEGALQ